MIRLSKDNRYCYKYLTKSPQKPNCNGKEQSDTIPKNTSDNVDTSRRNKEIQ